MDEVQTLGGAIDGYTETTNPFCYRNSSSNEGLNSGFGAAFTFCTVDIILWVLLLLFTIGSYRNKGLLRAFSQLIEKSKDLNHGFWFRYSKISSCLIGIGKFSIDPPPVEEKSRDFKPRIGPSQENLSCSDGVGIGGDGVGIGGRIGAGGDEAYSEPIQVRFRPSHEISEEDCKAEEMSIEELMKAIEIEREEKNAAYIELDKERMSSTLAANEAMDMIMRLQSEKSSIQMEANQSKRLAEQKQQYDQEIIQSLQWVIFKHESDTSVLENQLKLCRLKLRECLKFDEMEQFEEELWNCANVVEEDGASTGSRDTGSETSSMMM